MDRRRVLRPAASAAALMLAVAMLVLAACSEKRHDQSDDERAATVRGQPTVTRDAQRGRAAGPPVRIEVPAGLGLESPVQAELAEAARRFSTTLTGWLYGARTEVDVEPVAPELRRKLARAPTYVPEDQIGSGEGEAVRVEVFLQTSRSGVLAVAIRDSRTNYPIQASFERRAGRWLIVHLHTH